MKHSAQSLTVYHNKKVEEGWDIINEIRPELFGERLIERFPNNSNLSIATYVPASLFCYFLSFTISIICSSIETMSCFSYLEVDSGGPGNCSLFSVSS